MALSGKVAVITGSSVGVGRAAAIQFASKGSRVVINYSRSTREASEAEDLCRKAGGDAMSVQADVSSDAECRKLIQAAVERFGRIDFLVNNAGTTRFVNFADLEGLSEEVWETTYRTNVMGGFFCTRAAVPHMKRGGGGSIVNVASIAGIMGVGSSIAYAASKAAMLNMTRALARTLAPDIRVNAVAPGAIDTRWLRDGLGEKGFEALCASLQETTPLQAIASAEDVADAIVWLCEGARMVTGDTIIVDGGYHLGPRLTPRRQ